MQMKSNRSFFLLPVFLCALCASGVQAQAQLKWDKRWLTAIFYGEGANFGDFNKDGKIDVVSGPFIYDGPEFTMKHPYTKVVVSDPLAYSRSFFAFSGDLNRDGWTDIIIIGFPGEAALWYENPQGKDGEWTSHVILDKVDNESPTILFSNDSATLLCMSGGQIGYATPDKSDPAKPWTWHPISPQDKDYQRFTHGIGSGDVNGDGHLDILEKNGWWEAPASLEGDPMWKKHEFAFAPGTGSSQMYAYDVDGDGDNDVITALNAHGYGLAWYENVKEGDNITFKQHLVLSDKGDEKLDGVQFSQLHAVDLVDIDGDGLKDLVTGKRWWAHGPKGDQDPNGAAVLYWFKLKRENGKATYEPHQIDDSSGIGTQIVAADANGDGTPDVIVSNKRGTILFLSKK
jgi:hypothetical protein